MLLQKSMETSVITWSVLREGMAIQNFQLDSVQIPNKCWEIGNKPNVMKQGG